MLRMELAAHYRRFGVPSEAARWGATTPGWATDRENRDLRRWLLGRYSDHYDYARPLLLLPSDAELPIEVRPIVNPRFVGPTPLVTEDSGRPGCALIIVALVAALASLLCWLGILWSASIDADDLVGRSRALAVTGIATGLTAVGAWWWMSRLDRARRPADAEVEPVDSDFVVRLARRLASEGDERAAMVLLTAALRLGSGNGVDVRRTMVALSREGEHWDQAGRWGIGLEGATTSRERAAFARMLSSRSSNSLAVGEAALLSPHEPLTTDAKDVYRRVGWPAPTNESGGVGHPLARRLARQAGRLAAAIGGTVGVLVIVLSIAGSPLAPVIAGWAVAITCLLGGIAAAASTIHDHRRLDSRSALIGGLLVGTALTAGGVWLILARAFGWE